MKDRVEVEWEVLPPEDRQRRTSLEPLFKWVAIVMDGLLRVPGTKFRFGLNPLVDFVPAIGDLSAAFVSVSVLMYAIRRGLPKILLARMALNILINELVAELTAATTTYSSNTSSCRFVGARVTGSSSASFLV